MGKANITKLTKFDIYNFRGLKNIQVEFGEKITVICGKNGTSKSTLLGVAAQIFSFEKDYSVSPPKEIRQRTLNGRIFKSGFSEHFRFSETYDRPGGMDITISLYDGAFRKSIDSLRLGLTHSKDRKHARPVVRNNIPASSDTGNTSRNVTHPVIYLSLSRLIPISQRKNYSLRSVEYIQDNIQEFRELCSEILNRYTFSNVTATEGDVKSAVAHSDAYDQDSVSVGEDNVGQLVLALMSFKKLKDEYEDYHGGLLLIDEADAGLFPAAQANFISVLSRLAKQLDVQVVMTTHSPVMIEEIKRLSGLNGKEYKTVYLTDTFGDISVMEDWGWDRISADINTETVPISSNSSLPKLNVYFEDDEAYQFFDAIVRKRNIKQPLALQRRVRLSCDGYKSLIRESVEEFSRKSIVVFDADVKGVGDLYNCVKLPGGLPPDQLLFEFLFKMPRNDVFWKNSRCFTKDVFFKISRSLLSRLGLTEGLANEDFDLKEFISKSKPKQGRPIREDFKEFYKQSQIQDLIKGKKTENPFFLWGKRSPEEAKEFTTELADSMKRIMIIVYGVDESRLKTIV